MNSKARSQQIDGQAIDQYKTIKQGATGNNRTPHPAAHLPRRKRNRHLVLRTLETLGPARTLLFSSALREGLRIPGLLSVTLETDLLRLRRPLLPPETMGSVTLAATSPPLLQQLPSHRPPVPLTLAILV